MTPLELFEEARLSEALAAQRELVLARPDDIAERFVLCDFLGFAGQRSEILKVLDGLGTMPPELDDYVCEWLEAIGADLSRHDRATPRFFRPTNAATHARMVAYVRLRDGLTAEALEKIDDADEVDSTAHGFVDGRAFEGWRDSDELLGTCLEAFWKGIYYWIPFEHIRKLRFDNPTSLRDGLYTPAAVQLFDGSEWEVFLPALYVNSADHAEEGIRTGAGVDWIETDGIMRGLGERTFLFGEEELGISEFRQVEIKPA